MPCSLGPLSGNLAGESAGKQLLSLLFPQDSCLPIASGTVLAGKKTLKNQTKPIYSYQLLSGARYCTKALYVPDVIQSSQPPPEAGMIVSILQMNGLRLEAAVAHSPPGRGKSKGGWKCWYWAFPGLHAASSLSFLL